MTGGSWTTKYDAKQLYWALVRKKSKIMLEPKQNSHTYLKNIKHKFVNCDDVLISLFLVWKLVLVKSLDIRLTSSICRAKPFVVWILIIWLVPPENSLFLLQLQIIKPKTHKAWHQPDLVRFILFIGNQLLSGRSKILSTLE